MSFIKAAFEREWFPALLFLILLLFLSLNHFLYWDTVQFGSLHPDFYFQSDWNSFWLPPELDSGHPPFFGRYIALWWSIFGKSLPVTHLALWPIALGIFYQLWRLVKTLFPKYRTWIIIALLLEPVLLGQISLVSPDLVLIFAFLLGINEINTGNHRFLMLAVIILGMVSTRGMMLGVVLFLWFWLRDNRWVVGKNANGEKKNHIKGLRGFKVVREGESAEREVLPEGQAVSFWEKIWRFIPGGIIAAIFLGAHYLEFGWIGYHEGSTWAPAFETVDFKGLLRNFVLVSIHLLDFGHIFMFAILLWIAWKNWSTFKLDRLIRQYFFLAALLLLFLLPTLIIHKYLFNHRYLMSFFIILDVLALYAICVYWKKKNVGVKIAAVFLLIGSFWIYPQPIATSWDSTILHWGYYPARKKMMQYIELINIPLHEIGTAFPNINSPAIIDLKESKESFVKKDLNIQDWIFYSNVMNDFTAEELELLDTQFELVEAFKYWPVRVELYRRKSRGLIGSVGRRIEKLY